MLAITGRQLNWSWFFVLTVALFSGGAVNATDAYQRIEMEDAGIHFQVPAQWHFDSGIIFNEVAIIKILRVPRNEYLDFKDEKAQIENHYSFLSKTVKLNRFYFLLETGPFEGKRGIKGSRSTYGYTPDNPFAISYFFTNRRQDFIQVRLVFRSWDTAKVWQEMDRVILDGLDFSQR